MNGSPPSPISSEAAYESEMPSSEIHDDSLDEICDEIRSRLEMKTKPENSEEPHGNLVNFPDGKIANVFPEDESIASENSFVGMAALHHSNQELKALLESLTTAVQDTEEELAENSSPQAQAAEKKSNERDNQLTKMQIEAELVHSAHQKKYDKLYDKMLVQEQEIESLRHKIATLTSKQSEMDREKTQFENEAVTLRQEKQHLKEFAAQVEEKYHELRTRCANIVYQHANQKRELEKRDNEIRELNASLQMRSHQLQQSNSSFESQREVIEKLQHHVGNQQQHMTSLVEQQERYKADIDQHREVNAKTKDMLTLARKMSKSKLEIRDREIDRLKSVIEGLNRKLESFEYEYRDVG